MRMPLFRSEPNEAVASPSAANLHAYIIKQKAARAAAVDKWMKVYERIAGSALQKRPDLAKQINVVVK
jgi:hypothetical protein